MTDKTPGIDLAEVRSIFDRSAPVVFFDRWLAEHDRAVADDAWQTGAIAAGSRAGQTLRWHRENIAPLNPFRDSATPDSSKDVNA